MLLGMTGLRQFVPQYSTGVAPISDLLRDPRFRTKRAKKEKVPWGEEQNKDFNVLIEVLMSPPILALPVWTEPFSLSTDASDRSRSGANAMHRRSGEGDRVRQQKVVERGLQKVSNRP